MWRAPLEIPAICLRSNPGSSDMSFAIVLIFFAVVLFALVCKFPVVTLHKYQDRTPRVRGVDHRQTKRHRGHLDRFCREWCFECFQRMHLRHNGRKGLGNQSAGTWSGAIALRCCSANRGPSCRFAQNVRVEDSYTVSLPRRNSDLVCRAIRGRQPKGQ